jgi:3-methylcrotonyl-CoA carboxylase alpha subunit
MAEAQRVGFPLIIKASAGGGGKGMQVVNGAAEVAAAVESAQRLARTAFGDDRLLLERYFPLARHVEVQVFADSHGGIVSLFDRDCSVQRRHQKIIEEAPAPGLREEVRLNMSRAAVQAARAVSYVGAGTVEFLVDEAQHFYFMEMNTRLQVEHPVTELIAGVDLVEWQLRIAQGAPLPKQQADIVQRGAAMEARLYAEDPAHGYLPSVGRITHLHWPAAAVGLRLDTGVDAGDEVSTFYDPMLGKVISWGETRDEAIGRLSAALEDIEIVGVTTNRALLCSVLADEEFRRGGIGTNFLELRHAQLAFGEPPAGPVDAALAALWYATRETSSDALWADTRGWRLAAPARSTWRFADRTVIIECGAARDTYLAHVGTQEYALRVAVRDAGAMDVEVAGELERVHGVETDRDLHLFRGGRHVQLRLSRTEDSLQVSAGAEEGSLLTPLPGTVVAVHVEAGRQVARGVPLVTVEAMKMEHTLTAPYDGTVTRVAFGVGDRVAAGAILVELAPAG